MPLHRFAVGQPVRLKRTFGPPTMAAGTFRITATLPEPDNSPQYRIRSDEERHERVVMEDSLEIAAAPLSGVTSPFPKGI